MSETPILDKLGLTYVCQKIMLLLNGKVETTSIGIANGIAPLDSEGRVPIENLPDMSSGDSLFSFDTYAQLPEYNYSYNKSTKTETITYNETTFATRQNVKNSDGSWTVTTTCLPLNFSSVKKWTKDASGNWSAPDTE